MSVNELVTRWRKESDIPMTDPYCRGLNLGTKICAAELEAALQQQGEAVAWLCDAGDGVNCNATTRIDTRDDYAKFGRTITPLYTHPPKPVVSELEARIEELEDEVQAAQESVAAEFEREASRYLISLAKLVPDVEWEAGLTASEMFDAVAEHIYAIEAALGEKAKPVVSDDPGVYMVDVARHNLRHFIAKSLTANEVDKRAAIKCLDTLEDALRVKS